MSEEIKEEKKVEVPEKFKALVESIEKLSVLDLSELVKVLEGKFGVSAAAPMMVAAAGSPARGGAGEAGGGKAAFNAEVAGAGGEEKSSFNVERAEAGGNKIAVIKVVREVTAKGLKEAKDMVDGAPKVIKEGASKTEAEEIKKKLEEAGAKVNLK